MYTIGVSKEPCGTSLPKTTLSADLSHHLFQDEAVVTELPVMLVMNFTRSSRCLCTVKGPGTTRYQWRLYSNMDQDDP